MRIRVTVELDTIELGGRSTEPTHDAVGIQSAVAAYYASVWNAVPEFVAVDVSSEGEGVHGGTQAPIDQLRVLAGVAVVRKTMEDELS